MSQFDQLLKELNARPPLSKSLDGDDEEDKRIAAAAEDADTRAEDQDDAEAEDEREEREDKERDDDDSDEGEDDDDTMGKSMTVYDADGNPIEAVDGTELVKSLQARMDQDGTAIHKSMQIMLGNFDAMAKALTQTNKLVKSLQSQVEKLSDAGRGRKSTVTVHDRPRAGERELGKSEGVEPGEFLQRTRAALQEGRINGQHAMAIENHLNKGLQPPEELISKVMGA